MADSPAILPTLERAPRILTALVVLFCFFTAAPLYDVPMIGISVTAPLAGLLVYTVLNNWHGLKPEQYKGFMLFLSALFFALLISWAWNVFSGGADYGSFSASAKTMLRYAFWFLCAMLACRLFTRTDLADKAAKSFALAVVVLSLFVLAEYLLFGGLKHSGWSRLTTLSQNGYGVQYSTFLPFVYYALLSARGRKRLWWYAALAICLLAILTLGSRSAWGTTLVSLSLFAGLYALFARKLALITLLLAGVCLFTLVGWMVLPEGIKYDLVREYDSLERLDRDKSWQIRLLQIQKGMLIFEESPFLGVGPSQFTYAYTELVIPEVLRYGNSTNFSARSAHNTYVQLLAEGGLAFALPFGLLLLWLAISGMRAAVALARYGELWGLAMVPSLASMSIHFWTLSGLTGTAPWFIYGMTAAMIYRARWLHQIRPIEEQATAMRQEGSFASRLSLSYPR